MKTGGQRAESGSFWTGTSGENERIKLRLKRLSPRWPTTPLESPSKPLNVEGTTAKWSFSHLQNETSQTYKSITEEELKARLDKLIVEAGKVAAAK